MSTRRYVCLLGSAAVAPAFLLALSGCADGEQEADATGSIVFTVNRAGHQEIWSMSPDGGNRRQLTEPGDPGMDARGSAQPAWSPDGTRIVYSSSGEAREEDQDDLEIYVMNADGTERRRLTTDHVLDATPAWSPVRGSRSRT